MDNSNETKKELTKKQPAVAQIKDDYTVVLNIGSNDNIKQGQKFLIYSLSNDQVIDPITKEELGYLEIIKGSGNITHVQEKISTLESNRKRSPTRTIKKQSGGFVNIFGGPSTIEEVDINDGDLLPFEDISVGDFAKLIN